MDVKKDYGIIIGINTSLNKLFLIDKLPIAYKFYLPTLLKCNVKANSCTIGE